MLGLLIICVQKAFRKWLFMVLILELMHWLWMNYSLGRLLFEGLIICNFVCILLCEIKLKLIQELLEILKFWWWDVWIMIIDKDLDLKKFVQNLMTFFRRWKMIQNLILMKVCMKKQKTNSLKKKYNKPQI